MNNFDQNDVFLDVKNLTVDFESRQGFIIRKTQKFTAVKGVSFSVKQGTTMGLVGESGSGKSTLGKAIIRLVALSEGEIYFDGVKISSLSNRKFFNYRKRIQMIFQDPFNSLNPRMKIKDTLMEPLDIHFKSLSKKQKNERIADLLNKVGLPSNALNRYPHEFSGGQRQRIGIARALAVEPDFLICDEPVSALDVSVQAQIINLLSDLQEELGLTYLFIAHDLAVVEHISDEVLVMSNGKIVEHASAEDLYKKPQNEYTKKLLQSVPEV